MWALFDGQAIDIVGERLFLGEFAQRLNDCLVFACAGGAQALGYLLLHLYVLLEDRRAEPQDDAYEPNECEERQKLHHVFRTAAHHAVWCRDLYLVAG